jgi:TATA-box binding protein (TBP) (component of TFIID and TFIIIB)
LQVAFCLRTRAYEKKSKYAVKGCIQNVMKMTKLMEIKLDRISTSKMIHENGKFKPLSFPVLIFGVNRCKKADQCH